MCVNERRFTFVSSVGEETHTGEANRDEPLLFESVILRLSNSSGFILSCLGRPLFDDDDDEETIVLSLLEIDMPESCDPL